MVSNETDKTVKKTEVSFLKKERVPTRRNQWKKFLTFNNCFGGFGIIFGVISCSANFAARSSAIISCNLQIINFTCKPNLQRRQ